MKLYSDRENEIKIPTVEKIDKATWNGIFSIFEEFKNNQAFSKAFPLLDKESRGIKGFDENSFTKRINLIIPKLNDLSYFENIYEDYNWDDNEQEEINSDSIFDFIEFCYSSIYDIENKEKFNGQIDIAEYQFKHYIYYFSDCSDTFQQDFKEKINFLFQRQNIAYKLNDDGQVERVLKEELKQLLNKVKKTEYDKLNELIEIAIAHIKKTKFSDRKLGLDKIIDAYENIKNKFDKDTKKSATILFHLLDKEDEDYRKLVSEDARNLEKFSQDYIRHHKKDDKNIKNENQIDYLFFRMFNLIILFLDVLEKNPASVVRKTN